MSKLLINGCSYTVGWDQTCDELGIDLGIDQTVNLSLSGSSNDRIFRSTLEYIFEHDDVDFVILALTMWDRQEAPWGINDRWVDYSSNGIMRVSDQLKYNAGLYKKYIEDCFKFDLDSNYIDKLVNNIIVFSGWLSYKNIRHVIFSSPGEYFSYTKFNPSKISYLNANPCVIDIVNWSSNRYMGENGGIGQETDFPLSGRHYDPKSFAILNKFLYNYIVSHHI